MIYIFLFHSMQNNWFSDLLSNSVSRRFNGSNSSIMFELFFGVDSEFEKYAIRKHACMTITETLHHNAFIVLVLSYCDESEWVGMKSTVALHIDGAYCHFLVQATSHSFELASDYRDKFAFLEFIGVP